MPMPKTKLVSALALLLVTCLSPSGVIASPVDIQLFQGKAIRSVDANGIQIERVVPIESVVPGDTVVYRYLVRNGGALAAEGVLINTAVDPNMIYVQNSATQDGVQLFDGSRY